MKKFTITLALSIMAVLLITIPCNAKGKAKHVVLIGLDGWGAYSVPKTFGTSLFKCHELGFHVYGCRSRIARIYTMGVQNT